MQLMLMAVLIINDTWRHRSWQKRRGNVVYLLFSLMFVFHACAIGTTLIPVESALYTSILPCVKDYLNLTGTWQTWRMFDSIPYDHAHSAELIARDASGHEHKCGTVLPDLSSDTQSIRVYKLYMSFQDEYYESYREPYLKNLGPAVKQRFPDARSYLVRMTSQQMRGLQEMRENGQVSTAITKEYGPYRIE